MCVDPSLRWLLKKGRERVGEGVDIYIPFFAFHRRSARSNMTTKSRAATETTIHNFESALLHVKRKADEIAAMDPTDKSVRKRLQLMNAVQKECVEMVKVLKEVVVEFVSEGREFQKNLLERCKANIINVDPSHQAKAMKLDELCAGGGQVRNKKRKKGGAAGIASKTTGKGKGGGKNKKQRK